MKTLDRLLRASQRADGALVALAAGLWLWKAAELSGRQFGLLRRNLGWGYVVDITTPLVVTGAVASFFLVRHFLSPKKRGPGHE
jgi:hypothetical protein